MREPNQSTLPTPAVVTPAAAAPVALSLVPADL
jgi:hypothetical protein